MHVAANEGRGAPSPRPEPPDRGGFPAALERAGEEAVDRLLAELAAPGSVEPGPIDRGPVETRPTEREAPAAGSAVLARAVERMVLLVNAGATPSVTLQLGRSLDVRIDQARAGVEVTIQAVHGLSPLAEAELPILVAALRARGVRVARAGVLAHRRQGRGSLTSPRSSATTAADDGSVAKW